MKILIVGACGKMGHELSALSSERGESVCGVDISPSPMPFPVYRSIADVKETVDVVIDFSAPAGLAETLLYCKNNALPAVLAATGYSEEGLRDIRACAEHIPLFQTGNLSLGVNLLQILVKRAAKVLGDAFDVEIIERHHGQKKDAPSGTALMLAESVREGLGEEREVLYGRHGQVGPRGKEIGIHAVRGGTIVGEHEVMFAGEDEIVTLSHSARSRRIFASGALKAAEWLLTKDAGLYDMDDLLADLL